MRLLSFDPSGGLSAAGAQEDDDLSRSVDILDEALVEVGLAVGEVELRDVSPSTGILPLAQPARSTSDALAIEWSELLAHEVGNYLGLFHTRESLGGIVENTADTADDEEGAKANLMFFDVTLSTATALSADQGEIIRSSPFVKAR